MQFDIVSLFPEIFESVFASSILKRASDNGLFKLNLHNLRQWAVDKYGAVDDKVFGGGVGMLIRCEPVYGALEHIKKTNNFKKTRVIAMSARGKRFTQKDAERLAKYEQITILCGHYEGFDARIEDHMVDENISIGDFVLTGGEIAAMVVVDSVIRLKKGVLGKDESSSVESFSKIDGKRRIEYPQYTRPRDFMEYVVPDVLVSGDPKKIGLWQKQAQLKEQKKHIR